MADLKNSMNYQGLVSSVALPGQENVPYYNKKYEYKVTQTWYVLELVEGEWYTRWEIKPGTLRKDLPWMEEVVRVDYQYSTYFKPLTEFDALKAEMESDKSYKPRRVERVVRNKPRPTLLEEYIQWRISVALERLDRSTR